MPVGGTGGPAAASAAATWPLLKKREVVFDFGAFGIAAGDDVWTLITVRPYDENHSISLESQALQPEFSVGFTVVFVRDHWRVEDRFNI